MYKILVVGHPDDNFNFEVLRGEKYDINYVDYNNAKSLLSVGAFDLVIATENGHNTELTSILKQVRSKSKEAFIIICLKDTSFNSDTLNWLESLAEEVGFDGFVPPGHNKLLETTLINTATRIQQRKLGPKFDELAHRILAKL